MDFMGKRKITFHCREANPGSSIPYLVALQTELIGRFVEKTVQFENTI